MRAVSVDSWEKAQPVVAHGVWGSSRRVFSTWTMGETLVLLVAREGVVVGTVAGLAQQSDLMIWSNDLFSWRLPLKKIRVLEGSMGQSTNSAVRSILQKKYGRFYGNVLCNRQKLDANSERLIDTLLAREATYVSDADRGLIHED